MRNAKLSSTPPVTTSAAKPKIKPKEAKKVGGHVRGIHGHGDTPGKKEASSVFFDKIGIFCHCNPFPG
ncbi:hypothetical protein [Desulfovibrio inopinatus]|uniref:hypothetical protein n=1 Tax=Desulfovibrio inopinatus TaxID=102109 RepID=UPI0012EB0DA9|nr:hypothetical protein [Desulfovibrio inopinatus]